MARWCRGYWSSRGRVEKGWNWVAECNNLGGAYIRKNVFFLRWRGERYIPKNVFFAIVPANPWSWKGGTWGAWEIAGRYSVIDLNDRLGLPDGASGGRQTIYTAGLNWYANRNI